MLKEPLLPTSVAALFAIVVALPACTGTVGGDEEVGEVPSPQCGQVRPGPSPIRRMTRVEYNATVRDLLGDVTAPANAFVPEEEALGFNNQAAALGTTQLLAEQYMKAAETLSLTAVADLATLLPCDPTGNEEACARAFIEDFGKRAFRRPLTKEENDRLFALYGKGNAEEDFSIGIALVVQAVLQSPHFLYRVEFGMPAGLPGSPTVVALDDYEVASRLSYLIWGSMPDEALMRAADEGKLRTSEDIAAQATRMLDDDKAREAVANFHTQWLGLSLIGNVTKDETLYPMYETPLNALWKDETLNFLNSVIFDDDGSVSDMLTAPYTMMNGELATFYGITDGPTGEAFERVAVDPTKRSGFLTQASLLAINAKENQSSPIHRGKFVRERLLCQMLPPPPNDIKIEVPEVLPGSTTRERFSQHREDPDCAGCHNLIDPLGFGFEHYDAVGLWRDTDQDLPIDSTGEILDTTDADGKFDGAVELAQKLADSEQVRQCVTTQWFRYGFGRAEAEDDTCAMENIREEFKDANYNVKELLIALTRSDAFRFRYRVTVEGGAP